MYGAAESLAEAGLIDVQQTNPKVYRRIAVDEVEGRLRERFESRSELVVDHLSALADRRETTTDQRQDVWRIEGSAVVNSRAIKMLETADATVTYAVGAGALVSAGQLSAVERLVSAGVDATVITDDEVRDRFEPTAPR